MTGIGNNKSPESLRNIRNGKGIPDLWLAVSRYLSHRGAKLTVYTGRQAAEAVTLGEVPEPRKLLRNGEKL